MILPNESSADKNRVVPQNSSSQAGPMPQDPPPEYSRDETPTTPLVGNPQLGHFQTHRKDTAERRFVKAFAYAFVLYLIIGSVVRMIVFLAMKDHGYYGDWPKHGNRSRHDGGKNRQDQDDGPQPPPPIFEDPPAEKYPAQNQCVNELHDWTFMPPRGMKMRAQTAFHIPTINPGQETLFFRTTGQRAQGLLSFDTSSPFNNMSVVNIDMSYQKESAFSGTTVCAVQPDANSRGIEINAPSFDRPIGARDILEFSIHVRLPAYANNVTLHSLETDLFNFGIDLTSLNDEFAFEMINFTTTNGPVMVQTITTKSLRVHTSNGAITGHFQTSGDGTPLVLETSNAPIMVSVDILGNTKKGSTAPAAVKMKTTNGALQADFRLRASYNPSLSYKISAITTNAPIHLNFLAQPPSTPLWLDAKTSNADASVSLHPAFEGSYTLETSSYQPTPSITWDKHAEDPAGRGRRRFVETSLMSKGKAVGDAWWGAENKGKVGGEVRVKTDNAPVQLHL